MKALNTSGALHYFTLISIMQNIMINYNISKTVGVLLL